MTNTPLQIQILLVEDNPGDVELIKQGFRERRVANSLHVVEDGVEAMAYLRKSGKYKDAYRPHLILLDINLPRKNGYEVLREVRADPLLKNIPILILSTSDQDKDIVKSYEMHVNAFVTKPLEATAFIKAVTTIDDFWLSIVHLPSS